MLYPTDFKVSCVYFELRAGEKKQQLFKDAEKWATRLKTCNCMEFGDLPVYNQSGEISAGTGERQKPAQNACAVPEETLN